MADKLLMKVKEGEKLMTQARVREMFDYDPETGFFTWKSDKSSTARAGTRAGSYTTGGYRLISLDGRHYREHRIAWLWMYGSFPVHFIDHINGKRDDNRIANLRDVPRSINEQNQRRAQRNSHTGFLGVGRNKSGSCYHARIFVNKKLMYLGFSYKTPEEAHQAYLEAKRKYHEGCML